jgi:hypothetical protein
VGTLSIDLQDGFVDDTVVIRAEEREVARLDGVTTNPTISRADAVDIEVPGGDLYVEIELPRQSLAAARKVAVGGRAFLTANVSGGQLLLVQVPERPIYL